MSMTPLKHQDHLSLNPWNQSRYNGPFLIRSFIYNVQNVLSGS